MDLQSIPSERNDVEAKDSGSATSQIILGRLRQSWRIWLIGLIVVGGGTSAFIKMGSEILEGEGFSWDAPAMLAIYQVHRPWLDALMIGITDVGYAGVFLLGLAGVVWLWRQRRVVASVALSVSVVGSVLLNFWLKWLYGRPRPEIFPPLTTANSYSFPSGHTMGAAGFYGFAAYLLWQQGKKVWAFASVLFALLIGFTRIYLGVHYPSDVLGALAVGIAWLVVVIGGYHYYREHYTPTETEPEPAPSTLDAPHQTGG